MKWLSISNNHRQGIYELWNNEERLLTLSWHPAEGTLRIATEDEKRVFLIRKEGFLRSRTVLRNEYGIKIGQLINENNQENLGTIELDHEKLNYSIQKDILQVLTIYRQTEPLAICELPSVSKKNFHALYHDLLILALCWYIFMPATKKQVLAYA